MDAFSRQFGGDAIILAQYHTTWLSVAEFEQVGFKLIEHSRAPEEHPLVRKRRDVAFMMRDNTYQSAVTVNNYPSECPPARREHQEWPESKHPWTSLA